MYDHWKISPDHPSTADSCTKRLGSGPWCKELAEPQLGKSRGAQKLNNSYGLVHETQKQSRRKNIKIMARMDEEEDAWMLLSCCCRLLVLVYLSCQSCCGWLVVLLMSADRGTAVGGDILYYTILYYTIHNDHRKPRAALSVWGCGHSYGCGCSANAPAGCEAQGRLMARASGMFMVRVAAVILGFRVLGFRV